MKKEFQSRDIKVDGQDTEVSVKTTDDPSRDAWKEDPSKITYASQQLKEIYVSSRVGHFVPLRDRMVREETQVSDIGTETSEVFVERVQKILRKRDFRNVTAGVIGARILLTLKTAEDVNGYCRQLGITAADLEWLTQEETRPEKQLFIYALGIYAQNVMEKRLKSLPVTDHELYISERAFVQFIESKNFCEGVRFCQSRHGSVVSEKRGRGRRPKSESTIFLVRERHDEDRNALSKDAAPLRQT